MSCYVHIDLLSLAVGLLLALTLSREAFASLKTAHVEELSVAVGQPGSQARRLSASQARAF